MRRKPTTAFVYLLGAYVIVQFIWWGFHLIDLTRIARIQGRTVSKGVVMIVGEGSVFLIILLFGLWKIKSSIKKEMKMVEQQHNFMLSVTHELKTPIAATKLYLQTLVKHQQLTDEKRAELMQKAIEETNRLETLVEQILTASRLEQQEFTLHKERISLEHFLADLTTVQEKRFQMPITVEPFESLEITTDRLMFTTILNNLIENAHKYASTEKGIELSVYREEYLRIRVRDFGKGIPQSQQQAIFRKFVRLENEETRTTKGTGLGLYIAYEFTRALGGQLRLVQQEGPGACFEIHIPYE